MIKAEIVADSLSPQGDRLVSVLCTFPRIILAEVNTHRMLSKNTSSSRAIPFFKMVESIINNPFIPIAWQTHHKGMQGSEYISMDSIITAPQFFDDFIKLLEEQAKEDKVVLSEEFYSTIYRCRNIFESLFYVGETISINYTIKDFWLKIRDIIVFAASTMYTLGKVSKQICNRLLEPFMWTTMLITGPIEQGWDNFFNLRCPNYEWSNGTGGMTSLPKVNFKSRIDYIRYNEEVGANNGGDNSFNEPNINDDLGWLKLNTGAAEIHMMQLAECIWDTFNESTPKQLIAGDYHIPFDNVINVDDYIQDHINNNPSDSYKHVELETEARVKVSTAMAARTSYTIVGEEKAIDIKTLIGLHDRLINQNPPHSSPMEHCGKCMSEEEYFANIKTNNYPLIIPKDKHDLHINGGIVLRELYPQHEHEGKYVDQTMFGWCRNFRGFIPYRHIIENGSTS